MVKYARKAEPMTKLHSLCIAILLAAAPAWGGSADVLATLRPKHPRLMLTDGRLAELRTLAKTDKLLARYVADAIATADRDAKRPVLKYVKRGPRLLSVSRAMVNRTYALGLAYRWTGKAVYRDKLVENLLAVCAFKDWNPSHFLDTAEMAHGVGVAYDWLFDDLDAKTRKAVRDGLIASGLKPGLSAYETGRHGWWVRNAFNWNQVCNGGLIVGALAIAETDPSYARKIVPAAAKSLPRALKTYAPDGAWPEGPGYWGYASRYTVHGLAGLQTALGTDLGLSKVPGLSQAGYFPIYGAGPTGLYFNYADVGERSRRRPLPSLFWLGRQYDTPAFIDAEHAVIAKRRASPRHVIWYTPPSGKPLKLDLDRRFRGSVEVALLRSRWNDPTAMFIALKAGYNQVNHGHLDLGSFELDAGGVRWARDIGSDNYNLPGYWSGRPGGKRWTYYRLNSLSHSIPLLGGKGQDPLGKSRMIAFRTTPAAGRAVVDLTDAYDSQAKKVLRGASLLAGRKVALVQDEFEFPKPVELTWAMTTDAKIAPTPGGARLTIKDKRLTVRILSPLGAAFTVESAEQKAPQRTNKGVRRLILRIPKAAGKVRIAVALTLVADTKAIETIELTDLKDW